MVPAFDFLLNTIAQHWHNAKTHSNFATEPANSPQTNGICERFHRTIKDEFYDIAFRKKLYRSLEELQTDLDMWLHKYNEQRPHSGRYCYGKTPMKTFRKTLHIAVDKTIKTHEQSDNAQHILTNTS